MSLACEEFTTPRMFFTIPATQKKLALRGVGSGASQLRQALRALAVPNALRPRRRRFACFVLTSSATTSLHVRCWARGVPLPLELVWHGCRQSHRISIATATLFVRCRSLFLLTHPTALRCSPVCSLWLSPTLTAERPASFARFEPFSVACSVLLALQNITVITDCRWQLP